MRKNRIKICIWLFGINFFISAFTFGGGYIVIPMIKKYFVDRKQLFNNEELMDMAAIAQSSPGAIAINLTVLAGYKAVGMIGAVISCIAAVFPPLIILGIISVYYLMFRDNQVISSVLKGMEAGVGALIVDIVLDMSRAVFREKQKLMSLIIPATFLASFIFQMNVIFIILFCSVICFIDGWRKQKKGEKICGI
ncbi:MAG: chromate transporter [Fusobacterium varium]|uniref:chromate transporter n=1 Tax=Fusobacterium varium TaxID=856 RepID=UPI002432A07E|nr:chromate transporter [Fusobacterium varium]MCI6031967.1 chromate transporter [Fusobacterium varium]UYI78336.1 MAG: chromate transporter [Fusobacterium varium]